MTRIRMNPDGTRTMLSWSYFGAGDADAALHSDVVALEESNRRARAEWDGLTPEERHRRTEAFHRDEATLAALLSTSAGAASE